MRQFDRRCDAHPKDQAELKKKKIGNQIGSKKKRTRQSGVVFGWPFSMQHATKKET